MTYKLSAIARDVLIDHLDGSRVRYRVDAALTGESRQRMWLKKKAARRLIHKGRLVAVDNHYTTITEKGRATLAEVLAEYADALVRAGAAEVSEDQSVIGPDGFSYGELAQWLMN